MADVLSCGVRARKALFYMPSAGSDFLSGSVKWCGFLRKWCSKWCSGMTSEDTVGMKNKGIAKSREI